MSRAGRRQRLRRLEAAERVSADVSDDVSAERAAAMCADRDDWVRRTGTRGWEIEQARRRRIRTEAAGLRWRTALWSNRRAA